jgi:predicted  nucleic acid-binding Zn-ribbon protein
MPATADNLRDLHVLHQRAKALRDRLISGPKTLAARQATLATRRAAVEEARKALQDEKVQVKKREHLLQGHQTKIDDLKVKRNLVKKNEEYKAIQNQLAHDEKAAEKLETEILEAMIKVDEQAAVLVALEAEAQKTAADIAAIEAQIQAQSVEQELQLRELEDAILDAEEIIAIDQREQYRRNVKQRGAAAFASVDLDSHACSGCFVSVPPQTLNELINCTSLNFCKTCGRILYLAEEDLQNTLRKTR